MTFTQTLIFLKQDTVENWKKSDYIPAKGEYVNIIFNKDTGAFETVVGDGVTTVTGCNILLNRIAYILIKNHGNTPRTIFKPSYEDMLYAIKEGGTFTKTKKELKSTT